MNRVTRGPSIPKAPVLNGIFTLHTLTVTPALILGRVLQLIMNSRGCEFAGKYKICAILDLLGSLFAVAAAAPPIVGRSIHSFGLDVEKGTELVAIAALAFQAVWYPVVSPIGEDEDFTSK
ncbi:hypothetical protein BYT27DRAFT_7249164 [Phlegmacium glaucopus]|nr:hypothetical protein BYT27DRAFT_7249164 [Phlegmacium glaucopus]